jgi:hypothetical protein
MIELIAALYTIVDNGSQIIILTDCRHLRLDTLVSKWN